MISRIANFTSSSIFVQALAVQSSGDVGGLRLSSLNGAMGGEIAGAGYQDEAPFGAPPILQDARLEHPSAR